MNSGIAYCGLVCGTCPIHVATMECDALKRREMRESIARVCVEQYRMKLSVRDITDCDGCRSSERLFPGCTECGIRRCASRRSVESCAYCGDYACEMLKSHFSSDTSAQSNLEKLRTGRRP